MSTHFTKNEFDNRKKKVLEKMDRDSLDVRLNWFQTRLDPETVLNIK